MLHLKSHNLMIFTTVLGTTDNLMIKLIIFAGAVTRAKKVLAATFVMSSSK